jgi:hypothetical protein
MEQFAYDTVLIARVLMAGRPSFQSQLINFFKNAGIWGGQLFIASVSGQLSIFSRNTLTRRLA